MEVRFRGGPLDGRVEDVADIEVERGIIYWPPGAMNNKHDDDQGPGLDNVVEYLYRGDGTADYVSGLLDDANKPDDPST